MSPRLAGDFKCSRFDWVYDTKTTTVWVERNWPRKIVKWTEADGSTGELVSTARKPYWKLHTNIDMPLRQELKIE